MSTMLTFADNTLSSSFLTKEDISVKCPMALRKEVTNPKISERYVFANTETVIDDLAKLGWYPVEAKQCREKAGSKGIRSFHMIAFQNPNVAIMKEDAFGNKVVDCYPRIILTNSHDGFNAFKFMVGLFRLVCSNGLIIATDKLVELNIRHVNYDFEELRVVVTQATAHVFEQTRVMNEMQKIILTEEQKYDLAVSAIRIRKGMKENQQLKLSREEILSTLIPVRDEDMGDNLWNVFNVLQEHMMNGDFKSTITKKTGKPRKARALKSVVKTVDFNKDFFRAAYSYVEPIEDAVVVEA